MSDITIPTSGVGIQLSDRSLLAYVLGQFVTENIFISTGAGNRVGYIDGYPALFRSTQSTVRIPNLLVVGNVQNDGMLTLHQSLQPPGYLITETFAPGVNVGCANLAGGVDPYGHDGTSICEYYG